MSTLSINGPLAEDHERLDELLKYFQKWKTKDFAKAKDFLVQFMLNLQCHLRWEETILLPLFEWKTGPSGLTNTLRREHEEVREWLGALGRKVEQNAAVSRCEIGAFYFS